MGKEKEEAISTFLSYLPKHECALTLTHNEHKSYHQTVEEYLRDTEINKNLLCPRWKSKEAKRHAIETNEMWELHWYPEIPGSFFYIAAPTLLELVEYATE